MDKGKGLKIGTTYNSDKSARMFAQAIADICCGSTRAFAHGKVGIYRSTCWAHAHAGHIFVVLN